MNLVTFFEELDSRLDRLKGPLLRMALPIVGAAVLGVAANHWIRSWLKNRHQNTWESVHDRLLFIGGFVSPVNAGEPPIDDLPSSRRGWLRLASALRSFDVLEFEDATQALSGPGSPPPDDPAGKMLRAGLGGEHDLGALLHLSERHVSWLRAHPSLEANATPPSGRTLTIRTPEGEIDVVLAPDLPGIDDLADLVAKGCLGSLKFGQEKFVDRVEITIKTEQEDCQNTKKQLFERLSTARTGWSLFEGTLAVQTPGIDSLDASLLIVRTNLVRAPIPFGSLHEDTYRPIGVTTRGLELLGIPIPEGQSAPLVKEVAIDAAALTPPG